MISKQSTFPVPDSLWASRKSSSTFHFWRKSYILDDVKLAVIQQQFWMKECDKLEGGVPRTPRIYAPELQTTCVYKTFSPFAWLKDKRECGNLPGKPSHNLLHEVAELISVSVSWAGSEHTLNCHGLRSQFSRHLPYTSVTYLWSKVKVKCVILLLGIGGVLISLSEAMSP